MIENVGQPTLRRYWVLILLCSISICQCCTWITFGPVYKECEQLYGWSRADVNFLTAVGPIAAIPCVFLCPYIVNQVGLQSSLTIAAVLLAVANILRSITTKGPAALVLATISQILNASCGPFVLSTPSTLSSYWFPVKERTFATSVAVMANYLGGGVAFLLSLPIRNSTDLVALLQWETVVSVVILCVAIADHLFFPGMPTHPPSASAALHRSSLSSPAPSPLTPTREKEKALAASSRSPLAADSSSMESLLGSASSASASASASVVLKTVSVPQEPSPPACSLRTPLLSSNASYHTSSENRVLSPSFSSLSPSSVPASVSTSASTSASASVSASAPSPPLSSPGASNISKTNQDMLLLLRHPQFLLLTIGNALSLGLFSGWNAILSQILQPLGYAQTTAAGLGFWTTIASLAGSVLMGSFAHTIRSNKRAVLCMFVLAFLFYAWFSLQISRVLTPTIPGLYVSSLLGSFFLNSTMGLFYEMCVDITYPISDVSANAILVVFFSLAITAFQTTANYVHPAMMNWVLTLGVGLVTVTLAVFYKEQNLRAVVDGHMYEYELVPGDGVGISVGIGGGGGGGGGGYGDGYGDGDGGAGMESVHRNVNRDWVNLNWPSDVSSTHAVAGRNYRDRD